MISSFSLKTQIYVIMLITRHYSGNNLEQAKQALRWDFQIVIKWFYENYMVLNSSKCDSFYVFWQDCRERNFFFHTEMKNNSKEKILGIIIDNKLKFKSHLRNLWKKAFQKIWVLSILPNYLNDSEKNIF